LRTAKHLLFLVFLYPRLDRFLYEFGYGFAVSYGFDLGVFPKVRFDLDRCGFSLDGFGFCHAYHRLGVWCRGIKVLWQMPISDLTTIILPVVSWYGAGQPDSNNTRVRDHSEGR